MLLSNPFRPDPRVLKESESLSSAGYQVTVICWDRETEYEPRETLPRGTQIVRVQDVSGRYGVGALQLVKIPHFWRSALALLKKMKPDLIHCHDFDTLPAGLWWGKTRGIPVIYDAHEYYAEMVRPRLHGLTGEIIFRGLLLFERIGARLADAVITVDQRLAEYFRRFNHNVLIIGHYPMLSLGSLESNAFKSNEIRLLYSGRISEDRGMLFYISLLRELRTQGLPARLILAGKFIPENEQKIFLQASQDIQNHITNLGWVPYDQMGDVYRNADIGLAILQPIPRYTTALPVKVLEYMEAGLPVIASDFPLIREIVAQHKCGLLIDPVTGRKPAVEGIINWWHERDTAIQTGQRGKQAVYQQYNWETLMIHLRSLYASLLKLEK